MVLQKGDNKNNFKKKPHFIKCGPVPIIRDWRSLSIKELTRAEKNMRFIETHLYVPEGKFTGKKIVLAPFQELFFYAVFDNVAITREAILSMARKNAKSATIAMILICFLVGPEAKQNSQIVSGALSREQASIIFKLALKMINLSPTLVKLVKVIPSQKTLIGLICNVEYKALSSEAGTTHGLSPILAILDEIGQVRGPVNDFIDAVTTAQGAHENPLTIYISTQAPTDGDYLSIRIDDAEKSQDNRIVCHLYAADENCDLDDEEQWYKANPALGLFNSKQELADKSLQAIRMPSSEPTFRNLQLNQRVTVDAAFVSKNVWMANGNNPDTLVGKKVFGGLDLSAVSDLTALVLLSESGDVECKFWLPGKNLIDKSKQDRVPYDMWYKQGYLNISPGAAIEYEYIAYELRKLFNIYDIEQLNFDRFAMKFLKPWLIKAGFTDKELARFNDFGQGYVSMGNALRTLESLLLQEKLKHGNNPILTMCAGNAVIDMNEVGDRKFTKKRSTGRIDGMVSLAMAADARARYIENNKKSYSLHFI
jgi:phage terminase large subunit-like protein